MSEDYKKRYRNRCKYFTGIINDECDMHIKYADYRLSRKEAGDMQMMIPCWGREKSPCPMYTKLTDTEWEAHEQEIENAIEEFRRKVNDDICVVCDTPVKRYYQLGRCVYAAPCNHRQYQGELKP